MARVLGNNRLIKTVAMSWGIEKEKYAWKRYAKEIKKQHTKFSCEESGLILHSESYMLGASVDGRVTRSCEEAGLILHSECYMLYASGDGKVTCDCCGVGNLEIKSPFFHRDKILRSMLITVLHVWLNLQILLMCSIF